MSPATPIRAVIQQEPTGCAIASVAALAGVSYARAQAEANTRGIFAADPRLWSQTEHVRTLLRAFGLRAKSGETPFTTWERLPPLALLATKWHLERGTPFWHWAVYCRDEHGARVLDSNAGLKMPERTDFWRIKPKWFIEVRRAGSCPGA
ncbi:hypothetical protein E4T66_21160 [Sinimarinibacterium sp. CAU 1509]|uniref:hypothetical protein n=1 Tax=Sinimarinibacterium sp. CAU 1509 TaxID=2562283 RepID=UPI0010AC73F0|nr:hypothetical protein [Sinimarinibacterium sp. CAU 1509]TJY55182.1 hypothetical protein E4T66_21160 [Sinimarinibacterium sp. CAU 1509]